MNSKNTKVYIATHDDKKDYKSRIDRAACVGSVAPNCAIYQTTPEVKTAGQALVQAGLDLKIRVEKVNTLRAQLDTAEKDLEDERVEYDSAYDHYVANVGRFAVKPQDGTALGVAVLDRATYALQPPISVSARYDAEKALMRIFVKRAPGMRATRIEISPDPMTSTSWKELPGNGARAALSGYAPGVYWVRAASVVAGDRSEFTTPVAVIVK